MKLQALGLSISLVHDRSAKVEVARYALLTVEEENREHQPVYYVSRMLQGAESRYSQIEKLALSLITAARKLRPYFQSHQVVVLTNHPLKQVLSSPEVSGRMVKWAVELSEFGVEFQPRPAIKAQALADFIVELAYDEASISTPSWSLHVDGSSTSTGSGAGIVLESPEDAIQEAQANGMEQNPPGEQSVPQEVTPLTHQQTPLNGGVPSFHQKSPAVPPTGVLPPDAPPQEPMIQLTKEALLTLIRDASTRAAAQAVAEFVAQQPVNPPPPSPRRSREISSGPEEEEQRREEVYSRISRPEVAQTHNRNLPNRESSAPHQLREPRIPTCRWLWHLRDEVHSPPIF
ncbi:UNVERIFIED_CONTAM: hypothetical protein Sindi_1862400 [Sesamum indicum]